MLLTCLEINNAKVYNANIKLPRVLFSPIMVLIIPCSSVRNDKKD